jgi:hypothetical protein
MKEELAIDGKINTTYVVFLQFCIFAQELNNLQKSGKINAFPPGFSFLQAEMTSFWLKF